MDFCQYPEVGPKVGKKWALGAKVGENGSRPTFYTLFGPISEHWPKNNFPDLRKTGVAQTNTLRELGHVVQQRGINFPFRPFSVLDIGPVVASCNSPLHPMRHPCPPPHRETMWKPKTTHPKTTSQLTHENLGSPAHFVKRSFDDLLTRAPAAPVGFALGFWGGKSTRKNPPKIKTFIWTSFINNFCCVPDSCHREKGKSFSKLFEKVRAKYKARCFRWYFWILGGLWGL